MNEKQKDKILENWMDLVKECHIEKLYPTLLQREVLSEKTISDMFSSNDKRHNSRMFFFHLQETPQSYFPLIEALEKSDQGKFAQKLKTVSRGGCVQFREPIKEDQLNQSSQFKFPINGYAQLDPEPCDYNAEVPKSPIVKNQKMVPLNICVTPSTQFYDTPQHNGMRQFYRTRSKNRGQVLIINNDIFISSTLDRRNGATIDEENLAEMFKKMGLSVQVLRNQTAENMKLKIADFCSYAPHKVSDMCFLIIMSHGKAVGSSTVVLGTDGNSVETSWIEEQFNNTNCPLFCGKPKVILYQVCRGPNLDSTTTAHFDWPAVTETDSATTPTSELPISNSIRATEDVLIGHATLPGSKAHRNPYLGTWYIQKLCKVFMLHAHNTSITEMLFLVDQKLRTIRSEMLTTQTSEVCVRGFKQCFIHPGIYEDKDLVLKQYGSTGAKLQKPTNLQLH